MNDAHQSRRNFIQQTSILGIGLGIVHPFKSIAHWLSDNKKTTGLTILFQGDSITDGNRGRNTDPNHILGHGYAFSIASRVAGRFPDKANTFYNRGISGNKVTDLDQRWEKDCLSLKPDLLSILIGINDSSSVINQKNPVTVEQYETVYRNILQQTRQANPDCILVLCEPFILPVGKIKDQWEVYQADLIQRQAIVKRLSLAFQAIFVPLQTVFNEAISKAAANYWIWDGVHPTYAGHDLITNAWLKAVSQKLPYLRKLI